MHPGGPADAPRASSERPTVKTSRTVALSAAVLVVVLGAMLGVISMQRSAERTLAERNREGQAMLVAVLDLETGLRGFNVSGEESFLAPYRLGRQEYATAYAQAVQNLPSTPRVRRLLATQDRAVQRWIVQADARIGELQRGGPIRSTVGAERRRALIDRFRTANRRMQGEVQRIGAADRDRTSLLSLLLVFGVVAGLALLAWRVFVRDLRVREQRGAAELEHRREQRELLDAVQVVADEREAHLLVRRHLQRAVPDAEVTVLQRNNSDDRLVAATPVAQGSALAATLEGAEPRSCLAVRQARGHRRDPEQQPLLVCPVCGELPEASACEPFLVGGEVIGSVLVRRDAALAQDEADRVGDAVALAAPTLANLRTLAIAETQAATDPLTGLANRRSATAVLQRLASDAEREGRSLAAIGVDLDHFKRINDGHGHDAGDAVLAAVGQTLRRHVRTDDVVARMGGEEFLVLVAGIGAVRARELAEVLRREIGQTHVPGLDIPLSASLGVAVMPDHAQTPELLVRQADRALYRAKELGRDRVELALPPGHERLAEAEALDDAASSLLADDRR